MSYYCVGAQFADKKPDFCVQFLHISKFLKKVLAKVTGL